MTYPPQNKRSIPTPPASASPLARHKSRQQASPDPASLGFDMPEWLACPSSVDEQNAGVSESSATPSSPLQSSLFHDAAQPQAQTAPPRTLLEGMKVVCICKGIKKRVFWKALDEGVCTKNEMNRVTGSGSGGCQGRRCGPRIMEMIREALQW